MRLLAPILALLVAAPTARADILPPGHAGVRHTFEVRGLERAPAGVRFFAFPVTISGEVLPIEAGQPFSFYKFTSPRIYATRGELPEFGSYLAEPDLPASELALEKVPSVPYWRETRRIHTVFEFTGLTEEHVLLELVSETHHDANGAEVGPKSARIASAWYALPVLGLLGLLTLGLRRVRRPRD